MSLLLTRDSGAKRQSIDTTFCSRENPALHVKTAAVDQTNFLLLPPLVYDLHSSPEASTISIPSPEDIFPELKGHSCAVGYHDSEFDMPSNHPPPVPAHQARYSEDLQPIDEDEWVKLLSEIMRQAHERSPQCPSASQLLFNYIQSNNIPITWDDLALPGGRSLRSFRSAYTELVTTRNSGGLYPVQHHLKRTLPIDSQTPTGRAIAPKPLLGMIGPQRSLAPIPPNPMSPLGGHPVPPEPRKKRGRPSKKDQEERRRLKASESRALEASHFASYGVAAPHSIGPQSAPMGADPSHGAILSASLQRPSLDTTSQRVSQQPSSNHSGSSGKKRRGRPPKSPVIGFQPSFQLPESREANDTPPHIAKGESSRDNELSQAPVGDDGTSASLYSERQENKQNTEWKDTILNKP